MRATEFIDYLNRKDVALGRNVKDSEYTHISVRMVHKRARYQYQTKLRRSKNVL
mgnify:CR=1 FL=1